MGRLDTRYPITWTNGVGGLVTLVGICLLFQLPGITALPPIDRDEARFATATHNMLVGDSIHDWLIPEFDHRPRLNKPPLIYWVQAPFVALVGGPFMPDRLPGNPWFTDLAHGGIAAYRLASVLGATLAAAFTWWLGRRMFAPPVPWLAAVLLGSCALVMFDVRQARADQVLLACTVLAQLALWNVWSRRRSAHSSTAWVVTFWIAVVLGTLAKGPITPAIAALTILALGLLTREWSWLRRLHVVGGLVFIALMTVPWYIYLGLHIGWARVTLSFLQETALRSVKPAEGHWAPPGTHAALLPILFWPGSLALLPGMVHAFRRGLPRRPTGVTQRWWQGWRAGRDAEVFCLAWLIPGWLVFEVLATKLPHYPLPLYPPVALLCARGLYAIRNGWPVVYATRIGPGLLVGWLVVGELVVVAIPITLAIVGKIHLDAALLSMLIALALLGQMLLIVAARCAMRRAVRRLQATTLFAGFVAVVLIFQFVLPNLDRIWLSPRIVADIRRVDPARQRPLADAGYYADSLVFLTRSRVQRIETEDAAAWCAEHPDGLLLWADEEPGPEGWGTRAVRSGYAYSRGRWLNVRLLEAGSGSRE